MNSLETRARILLSMQVALLGMVTPKMRAVLIGWHEPQMVFRVIFDSCLVTSEQADLVNELETEMIAHFPGWEIQGLAVPLEQAHQVSASLNEVLVFRRAE
jgi:hypothetical protein